MGGVTALYVGDPLGSRAPRLVNARELADAFGELSWTKSPAC